MVYLMRETTNIDWLEVSNLAHGVGVGPKSEWLIDDAKLAKNTNVEIGLSRDQSNSFVKKMHSMSLAVHSYTL